MSRPDRKNQFTATLFRPAEPGGDPSWSFVVLPKEVSDALPRRGRTTVEGTINGCPFVATLDPDGRRSHWLKVSEELRSAASATVGGRVTVEIRPVKREPEPELPSDFQKALEAAPEARRVWEATTTIARVDWIHWMTSAKQAKTRVKRIDDACEMLAAGKKRVCCFDPSGYYSKAFQSPAPVPTTLLDDAQNPLST
ncbi:MAG: DUF1905 domain-containing protein [Verrucomicrobiaceae bacterium]|nr:DUF1905 domain-containing protein [Verrucomicrobiaceae bacterium]